jgi:sulfonate dioxygenase
LYGSELTDHF